MPVRPLLAALLVLACAVPAEAKVKFNHHHDHGNGENTTTIQMPDLSSFFGGKPKASDALTVKVAKTPLLPKAAPGGKSIVEMPRGTPLKKIGEKGAYYQVLLGGQMKGFVLKTAVAGGKK